ncbi:hypothetical protein Q9Q99_09930 [Curtobacterium flaccumfaciens]|nr:hypothetical protein Q9Q99_09930 [Curtobacterium flaccumfaciens]
MVGDGRGLAGGGVESGVHRGDCGGASRRVGRLGRQRSGQGAVHVGERGAELLGSVPERRAGLGFLQGDAPGVVEPGQELLGEGEVAGRCAVRAADVGPVGAEGPVDPGHAGAARRGEGELRGHVGGCRRGAARGRP